MDYQFFQMLSQRMESAEGAEQEQLAALRTLLLQVTEEIDQAQQEQINRASSLLASLVQAEQLDQAVEAALPLIDELFLSVLQANLRAAIERKDEQAATRLREIDQKIRQSLRDSMPPGLKLVQRLLETEDQQEAERLLNESADQIDDQALNALLSTAQRLEDAQDEEGAERLRQLHRRAMRAAMKARMSS
jgi:hypothetical protein